MKSVAAVFLVALAVACSNERTPAPASTAIDRTSPIPIDGRPSAVEIANKRGFVADDENHVVHVLNGMGRQLRDPIDVPRNPISMDENGRFVWIGHAGGELTRIDAKTYAKKVFEGTGSVTDVIAGPRRLWTVDLERSAVSEIDPDTGEVIRHRDVEAGAVRGVFAKGSVWISGIEKEVTRLDADDLDVQKVYEVGPGPIGLATDGDVVWVAVSELDAIVDVEGKEHRAPIEVGRGPIGVALAGPVVIAIGQDDHSITWIYDGDVKAIDLETTPRDIAIGDGGSVWVAGVSTNPGEGGNVVVRVYLGEVSTVVN